MEHPVFSFVCSYLATMHLQYVLTDGKDIGLSSLDLGLRSTILKLDTQVTPRVISHIDDDTVYHIQDYYNCNYCFFRFPHERQFLFVGPYLTEPVLDPDIYSLMEFLQIPQELFPQLKDYYLALPLLTEKGTLPLLLLQLYGTLFQSTNTSICHIDLKDLESQEAYLSQHEFSVPDDPILSMHLLEQRYSAEDTMLNAVASGNSAKALSLTETFHQIRFSPRGEDALRDTKNLMITFNTLLRRTVYLAGVHPFYIDAVSGNYARMIEHCRNISETTDVIPYMIKSYCLLAERRSMASYSEPVRKILVTVDASLTADLSLKRFANDLFLNTSYLSSLFKKEVGLTLTDYVNKNRIAHAKKLLKSTALSIQDIAAQSGIPDIHYFTRLFRRETGMSPREWRNEV